MKRLLGMALVSLLIVLSFNLCVACSPQPNPEIGNVVWQHTSTSFTVTWDTDIPTTSEVILCDEDAMLCEWFNSEDCGYEHFFTVKLDPTRHYKVTLIASHCDKEDTFEICLVPFNER